MFVIQMKNALRGLSAPAALTKNDVRTAGARFKKGSFCMTVRLSGFSGT